MTYTATFKNQTVTFWSPSAYEAQNTAIVHFMPRLTKRNYYMLTLRPAYPHEPITL